MTDSTAIIIGLSAVVIAADSETPSVLATRDRSAVDHHGLPAGPFDPLAHRTFELGLREWVSSQTGFAPEYVEQLYTFGDRGRTHAPGSHADDGIRHVSVGYLGLTAQQHDPGAFEAVWRSWYDFFPWEDHRDGRPALIDEAITPALRHWAAEDHSGERWQRARLAFGLDDARWIDGGVLERFELLYEAGLVREAQRDHGTDPTPDDPLPGRAMASDHRRIMATAIDRLRGKLRYRPVIFELLPERFTLSQLQGTIEAIIGLRLHKQNFRRALDKTGLVEATGEIEHATGGRPAERYRFRREQWRRPMAPGVQTPLLQSE
ncbi:NUDIX hydrolase [Kushneria phosphatilytica]|uniref:NAD regulator n=1 Tax=Kushneria phosphatilytica TaxID=657387 RepID=A0A1S1NVT9_9GAMM|nr:NAD regulator [Kushneria phosphatilytica]OHV09006.1 NAD regulator [Kushneria phosphatilytica]QEL12634.1 NAD regulator [Kushneria phosphatilytica]